MKHRSGGTSALARAATQAAAAVLIVAAAASGAWACNGDGGSGGSLGAYFEELEALDAEFSERSEGVSVDEPEDIDEARAQLAEVSSLINEYVDELDGVDPPAEARDAHDVMVRAGRDLEAEWEDLLEQAEEAASMDEFFTLLFDPGLNEANHALGRACAELVDIAEEHDINAQLVCAEDA